MAGELTGKRVLVVEDEYFIASDLRRALMRASAAVVGPVGDVESGLSLTAEPLDAAVLDVKLEGQTSFSIADRLTAHDVPFMFLTGFDGWALPEAYRDAPRLAKPYSAATMLDMVGRLTSRKDAR